MGYYIIVIFVNLLFLYFNVLVGWKLSQLSNFQINRLQFNQNIVLYPPDEVQLICVKEIVFGIFFFIIIYIHPYGLRIFLTIFLATFFSVWYSVPEASNVCELNKLSLGYGCALCYYKNYLTMIVPHNFMKSIEYFETYNNVEAQRKLFILFPQTCKIQKYIDNSDSGSIERCRELPEHVETVAGIKDRTYKITMYYIKTANHSKGVRLAVEYAMPLKGLYVLKENQQISKEEMLHQRQLFIRILHDFMRQDANDMSKFCELIEYDDTESDIADLLLEKAAMKSMLKENSLP